MRFIEILLEYKRDITKQKLGDRLVAAAKRDRNQDIDTILTDLEAMDPTTNKQYVLWLANQYIQGQFRLEDTDKVKDALEKFIKAKSRLPEKDIGKYTFYSLEDQMDKVYNVELNPQKTNQTTDQPQTFEVPPRINAQILYNGPLGLLAIPKTRKASCELGAGTKWCTAARENNRFAEYNKEAPLYIWRDKNGEKYQFWFSGHEYDEPQFMDAKDRPISRKLLQYFSNTHPVLKKLFDLGNAQLIKGMLPNLLINSKIQATSDLEYIFHNLAHYLKQQGRTLETIFTLFKDKPLWLAGLLAYGGKRFPAIEKILDLPNISTKFFDEVAEQEFSVELIEYIAKFVNQQIPALEQSLLKNLERNVGDDYDNTRAAIVYAKKIIKGNWPKLENKLAATDPSPDLLAAYIDEVKGRFVPELEKRISQEGALAEYYAKKILKTKWPEGEKAILATGGQVLDDYNKFLKLKGFTAIDRPRQKAKKKAKKKATRR